MSGPVYPSKPFDTSGRFREIDRIAAQHHAVGADVVMHDFWFPPMDGDDLKALSAQNENALAYCGEGDFDTSDLRATYAKRAADSIWPGPMYGDFPYDR